MRYLIFLIVFLCSCNIKQGSNVTAQTPHQDSLVIGLVQNDFLIFSDSSKIDSVRQSFIKDGYIFSTEINRYVHIDAEELAEGSFDFFKNDLTKILKRRGLEITFSTTENFEKMHEVMINNRRFNLYDDKNLADNSFWDIGARRFFKAINQELEKSKSNERFYLLYGGNDLGAILLTSKQIELIEKINEGNPNEIPYKP
jgi:hypothetical protein